jgi:outer membrane protein OmpA-like peptidoglycan-associated protein
MVSLSVLAGCSPVRSAAPKPAATGPSGALPQVSGGAASTGPPAPQSVNAPLVLGAAGRKPPAPAEPILSIAVTGTSAEQLPRLPASVRAALLDAARASHQVGGALVTISIPGRPAVEIDLTPMRGQKVENSGNRRETATQAKLDDLERLVRNAVAARPGLNTLGLLDDAARGNGGAPVVVLSSGVSTDPPLDLRQWHWPDDARSVVSFLANHRYLPLYLAHREVRFYYLGDVAGTQPIPPSSARVLLDQLYIEACYRAGADLCVAEDDAPSGIAPAATEPVPIVDVPSWTPPPPPAPTACEAVVNLPTSLLFPPDSSTLTAEADRVLRPLAQRMIGAHGHQIVSLIRGHTSDAGPGTGKSLSEQRARHVADELIALGVQPQWIVKVDGVGETEQLAPDWNPDGTPSPQSALNRRVEIKTRVVACATTQPDGSST